VTLESSIEDCLLSAEKCQPLGLILNELLTNVMKHAFVGKASGKAVVTFRVDGGRGVLVVQDDGLGLPALLDFENSPSLGLRLVRVLARQIGGTVRADRGNGTKVTVEFPELGVREEAG
jgi:two-component sensor histidine kinase